MNFQSLNLKTPLPDESRQQILNTGSSQRHIQPIIVIHKGQVCGLLCHSVEVIKGRSLTLSVSFTALKLDPLLLKRKETNPCLNANLQGVRSSSLPWVIWAVRQSHLFPNKNQRLFLPWGHEVSAPGPAHAAGVSPHLGKASHCRLCHLYKHLFCFGPDKHSCLLVGFLQGVWIVPFSFPIRFSN